MSSLFTLAIFLSIVGALSQAEKKCEPAQWSADMIGRVTQYAKPNVTRMALRGNTATDYKKQMLATIQNVSVDGMLITVHQITDFKQMKSYEINPVEKKCTTYDIPAGAAAAFKQYCEGDDVNIVGTLSLGGKMVYTVESSFENYTSYTTVSESYTPVSMVIQQIYNGLPQMVAYQYGNVTNMIPHMNIFDVPSYCMAPKPSRRVCAPHQFEGSALGQLGQVVNGMPMNSAFNLVSSWDYTNRVEASIAYVTTVAGVDSSRTVTKWNEQKIYVIDDKKMICTSQPTPLSDMMEFCSDDDRLTRIGSLTVDGKIADTYIYAIGSLFTTTTLTVFRETFEIITIVIDQIIDYGGLTVPQMLAFQYGNMTMGIRDRTVFDVPDYCNKQDVSIG